MPYVRIEDEELIYDRTRNFSGISDVFTDVSEIACPTKGSSVQFLAKDKAITTNNNWLNIMPVGINNVYANYSMVYEVAEEEAQKLANFLESKQGIYPVFFETDATVYRKINGYCTKYSVNQIDVKTFTVAAQFEVTESPGHLNWTGLNFLNPGDDSIYYEQENRDYKKNEIAYDQRLEIRYQDRLNNFYYCTDDHNASADTESNLEDSPYWTKDFFWQPDVGQSSTVEIDVQRFGDADGFPLRRKVKDNTASFPLTYRFSNIETTQLKSMLHFLESKNGYKRFRHRIGAVYNRPKVYVCRRWTHSWNSFNSHDLEVTFDEDPLGLIPDRVDQSEETLSSRVFDQSTNLIKQVQGDIPDGWVQLDEAVVDIKIGAGCSSIGDYAFAGTINSLGLLNIPGSVTSIGNYAFDGCEGFDGSLVIGGGVTTIGDYAFRDCQNFIEDLLIPPNTKVIGDYAFYNCNGFNGSFDLGKILSGMGTSAFQGCSNLNSKLTIPPTLGTIPDGAFRGCVRLYGDLDIPSGVENIGGQAFWNCKRIGTDIILPNTIKNIGANAFNLCERVYNVYINSLEAPVIQGDPFPLAGMKRLKKIHVPIGSEGYDTAYWIDKQSKGKLVFDILL